jgi:integrase
MDIGDRYIARYPIVSNPRDGVVLPIAAFFHHRVENDASEKSLEGDAYCLAEYWDYLAVNDIEYDRVTPDILKKYFDGGAKRDSNIVFLRSQDVPLIYKDTIRRKRGIIYNFYHILQNHIGIVKGVLASKNSEDDAGFRLPAARVSVGIGVPRARDGDNRTRATARLAKEKKRRPKGTPSVEEAELIIDNLLERRDQNRGSTYYLAASLGIYGGARNCGVEDLTLCSIIDALLDEPDVAKVIVPFSPTLDSKRLVEASGTQLRTTVVRALKALGSSGRRFVFAMVIEKGKARPLPSPVSLALEILDYIWSDRQEFIRGKQSRDPKYEPPDNVFLSYKTGAALKAGSISRVISKIFRNNAIPGTPHRLRATFAEEVVRDLYYKDKSKNGGKVDFISIIELASEMLGHSNKKTIKKYINNIVKKDRLLQGHVVVVKDPKDAALLTKISDALESARGGEIRTLLTNALGLA